VFDGTNNIGDTVAARYFVPAGANIPLSGTTANSTINGPNTYTYLTLPASVAYADPLVGSGELPTCNMVTNAAGNLVSTGQNCQWPANMSRRNSFLAPGFYNIDAAIGKTFPIGERFKLQFRSEFYNMLNHSNYYVQTGASADVSNGTAGAPFQIIGKRGFNPAAGIPNERRFIQLSLRLSF
jgi:hypothetical protein